jgi:penicillin-binding protein 1A
VTTQVSLFQEFFMSLNRIKSLPLIIFCAAAAAFPFAYFISAYTYSYSALSGDLSYDPNVSTKIYDVNGEIVSELFDENRTLTETGVIPPVVKRAFLTAEDKNFYLHSGFYLPGIARAVLVDMFSGDIKQGGSTITQQLVKQLYTKGEKTIRRKLIEILLAREFEKKYTKEQILEMYLSQIYFGHGVYGVSSAARFFFDKDLKDLTAVEASLLAAIPQAPNRFSPLKNPRAAFQKNQQILFNMINAGYIPRDEAIAQFNDFWTAYLENIKTKFQNLGIRNKSYDKAPYFTEYIRRALVEKYGEKTVYRGGLRVYTTLDLRQQKAAEEALLRGIEEQNETASLYNTSLIDMIDRLMVQRLIEKKKITPGDAERRIKFLNAFRKSSMDDVLFASLMFGNGPVESAMENYLDAYEQLKQSSRVEGALIALDPSSGAITAMVGGSDFNAANQLNRSVQSTRQPGSAFKAFVYGAGIESKKITPATPFYDVPVVFRGKDAMWKPSNYEKSYKGRVLVRNALASSLNIVSVLVVDEIDPRLVAEYASRLTGIPISRFSIDTSISLGTSDVSPLEMARGFAVYANGGRAVHPYAISYITDKNDNRIFSGEHAGAPEKRVISEETAFIMTSMLRSVVDSGTAYEGIRGSAGFYLPAGGKTGTTSNFRDAWFVGYTPDLAAAVWMGCDSQKFSLGAGQGAAAVAAPVWGAFMREVYTFRKPSRFKEKPDGVAMCDVCGKTGKLPIEGCPVKSEYFISGTEPVEKCNGEHDEMISIIDLVRKNKSGLIDKEKSKIDARRSEEKKE